MKVFSNNFTQRFATGLLCLVLLAVMLFSGLFIVLEHKHDCSGEDCPVCLLLCVAEANLTCLGLAEHGAEEGPVLQNARISVWAQPYAQTCLYCSLVRLKVRQNK